jgi:xylose isomerase
MSIKLSDLPIFQLAIEAEKKHGEETHMVIEAVSKDPSKDVSDFDVTTEDVVWWVEFENQKKIFETFEEVKNYFLNECS